MNPLKRTVPSIFGLLVLFLLSACMDTTGNSEFQYDNTPDLEFLDENRKKDGVTETESGLQYRIIEEGDEEGERPAPDSEVRIHYTGWLVNGHMFDSTSQGAPLERPVNGFIDGWIEGLQLMPVGSKYEFVIPSELGYGDTGVSYLGAVIIPPGATLIFEVELLDIL